MKIFGIEFARVLPEQPPADAKEKAVTMGAGILDLFERRALTDTKSVSSRLIEANTGWVYANVSAIAQEVSKLKPVLHRIRIVRGEVVFDQVLSHPVLDLLDRFNDFTTASEAFYLIESHIELAGDTFLLLDGKGTSVRNLFILPPDKVTLNIGDAPDAYRVTSYTYKDTIDGKTTEETYSADEIIQIKEPNPANPYRGKSVVEAAAQAIDTDNLAGEWVKQFFKNAARPDFALWTDKSVSPDDLARLEADLRQNFRGPYKAGRTMILTGGLKPETLAFSNKEMEYTELQKWTRDKIMALFKNTKVSLGIVEDVNRASAEESMATWKQGVIKPKMQRIVDSLNEFLVPRYGENLILSFEDPVPENRQAKVDEVKGLYGDAKRQVITANEARAMFELDPLKGEQFDTIGQAAAAAASTDAPPKASGIIPKVIRNVDYQRVLRRYGIHEVAEFDREVWQQARKLAKTQLKNGKAPKKETEPRESRDYTNEQVWAYWAKQVKVAEDIEQRFLSRVQGFLDTLTKKALENLDKVPAKQLKRKATVLFDEEAEIAAAIDLLEPLLKEIGLLSGEQAYQLLNMEASYVITNRLARYIERNTAQLAHKFIQTDIKKLNSIIAGGIESGEGIDAIDRRIRQEFGDFTKVQSARIARTEVMRAANAGAIDAFEESGIVRAKQWVTAMDERVCPICQPLNGKIIGLRRGFFTDEYFSGQEPPAHANCRCVALPVLKDLKAYEVDRLKAKLAEIEVERKEDKKYIADLEKVAGVSDADPGA